MEEEYPKVKVKVRQEEEEEDDDDDQFAMELTSLQSLKAFESLSTYESFTDDLPTSIARIPSSSRSEDPAFRDSSPTSTVRVPDSSILTSATSSKKENGSDRNISNIRANLVSRPRAVLSSPDNDTMIGSTNKTRNELLSPVRSPNLCQNRRTQSKVTTRPVPKGSNKPRASTITGHGKKDMHARGQLVTSDQSEISTHLKGKTEPLPRKTSIKLTNHK